MLELQAKIIFLIIGATILLLTILAITCIVRRLFKNRNFNLLTNDPENGCCDSEDMNKKLIIQTPKLHEKIYIPTTINTSNNKQMNKFLSVSLSEIPFIDEAYVSIPDLRISKTCNAIFT